jgi:hypothetical protein
VAQVAWHGHCYGQVKDALRPTREQVGGENYGRTVQGGLEQDSTNEAASGFAWLPSKGR